MKWILTLLAAAGWLLACASESGEARRHLVGRLSARTVHAPHVAQGSAPPTLDAALRAARGGAALRHEGARRPTPENLQALALTELDLDRLEAALELLEQALILEPDDAQTWSDLAAVLLEKASRDGEPHRLVHALAAAEQARELDPTSAVALWNLALALDRLALVDPARDAWDAVLDVEDDAGWASEARARREGLQEVVVGSRFRARLDAESTDEETAELRRLVEEFPGPSRRYLEIELLSDWGDAFLAGRDADAGRLLGRARRLADLVAELHGDRLPAGAVAAIDGAPRASRRRLAEAHALYREARKLRDGGHPGDAGEAFRDAASIFEAEGSPFAAWARFFAAVGEYDARRYDAARRGFEAVEEQIGDVASPNLRGRLAWSFGILHRETAEFSAALERFAQGATHFSETGELGNVAQLHMLMAEDLAYLGRPRDAWHHRARALELLRGRGEATLWLRLWPDIAEGALEAGEPGVARQVYDTMLDLAEGQGTPAWRAFARLGRMRAALAAGEPAALAEDLAAVEVLLPSIDADWRRWIEAEASAIRGRFLVDKAPKRATELLSSALDLYADTREHRDPVWLYLDRGRAHLALGDVDAAAADFSAGLREAEYQRHQVAAEGARLAYLDARQRIFRAAIRLELDVRGSPAAAFEIVERSRSRALWDALARRRDAPSSAARTILSADVPDLATLHAALPAATAVVEYVDLGDRLAIFVLTPTVVDVAMVDVDGVALAAEVERFLLVLGNSEDALRESTERLQTLLIAPIADLVAPFERLVLVPDGELGAVPFAALFDEHVLVMAPSAAVSVAASSRDLELAGSSGETSFLAVANPSFDRRAHPRLRSLDAAKANADRLIAHYPASRSLRAEEATVTAFLAAAAGRRVIHFAGHAVVDPGDPAGARLLLTPDGGGNGELHAADLDPSAFADARLVVLAACSTGRAAVSRSEGVGALVRPFLAAGVPSVLATLWPVADAPTAHFTNAFHARLARGDNPAAALRATQLEFRASDDVSLRNPSTWAAFVLVGGVAF